MEAITPDVVRGFKGPTDKFLCPKSANIYKIKFKKFRMRDLDSGFVLFEVEDDSPDDDREDEKKKEEEKKKGNRRDKKDEEADDKTRTIRYHLGPDFLELKNLGSSLTFSVGDKPVKNFLMIERHYFKNLLIKSYEFKFEFCIPNSTNTWESIYTVPEIDPKVKADIIANPWETKSDSFYFVEDKLIMHNKAIYNYAPLD